jgi:hypothetical protein
MKELNERTQESFNEYQATLKNFNGYSENSIDRMQSFASQQIQNINDESKRLAINTANEKITEAFKEPRIAEMIDNAAQFTINNYLEVRLNKMVKDANGVITNQMKLFPDLFLTTYLISDGQPNAFFHMDSLSKYSADTLIQQLAKTIIISKTKDYNLQIDQILAEINIFDDLKIDKKFIENSDTVGIALCLLRNIETEGYLTEIGFSFKYLKRYGYDIDLFDFDKAKQLKIELLKKHKII